MVWYNDMLCMRTVLENGLITQNIPKLFEIRDRCFSAWIWSCFHWAQWDMGWGSLSSWGICQSSHHIIKKSFSIGNIPILDISGLQLHFIPSYYSRILVWIYFRYFTIFSSLQYLIINDPVCSFWLSRDDRLDHEKAHLKSAQNLALQFLALCSRNKSWTKTA